MSALACPHCAASNVTEAVFCGSCGKAMPVEAGPRIVKDGEVATSRAGQELQSEDLLKKMRTARNVLLVLGILQLLLGGGLVALGAYGTARGEVNFTVLGVIVGAIGVVFTGLGIWAIWAPFAAALTGLVLYVTLFVVDGVADPTTLARGIIIKIIIIAALAKAVSAGVQYRALKRQMQAPAA